jgi:hypothetical protein
VAGSSQQPPCPQVAAADSAPGRPQAQQQRRVPAHRRLCGGAAAGAERRHGAPRAAAPPAGRQRQQRRRAPGAAIARLKPHARRKCVTSVRCLSCHSHACSAHLCMTCLGGLGDEAPPVVLYAMLIFWLCRAPSAQTAQMRWASRHGARHMGCRPAVQPACRGQRRSRSTASWPARSLSPAAAARVPGLVDAGSPEWMSVLEFVHVSPVCWAGGGVVLRGGVNNSLHVLAEAAVW